MKATAVLAALLLSIAGCTDSSTAPGLPDASGDPPVDDAPDAGGVSTTGCTGLAVPEPDSRRTLESSGRTRQFHVHVPPSYDPETAMPLVLNFHGYTMDGDRQQELSKMNAFADETGFIAVHPDGVGNSWNAGGCCGEASAGDVDDVQFVRDLLDDIAGDLCVDAARIYSTGLSNGGHLSYRLACDLSDRIAGIAPVAGTDSTLSCAPARATPIIHFHGTSDLVVPFDGSILPAVDDTVAAWAAKNGCGSTTTRVFSNGDSVCEQFDGCPAGAAVTLCTVDGGGHTWPGGTPLFGLGKTTEDLDATATMWEFWDQQQVQ